MARRHDQLPQFLIRSHARCKRWTSSSYGRASTFSSTEYALMHSAIRLSVVLAVLACKDSRTQAKTGDTAALGELADRYELVSMGGRPVPTRAEARATCDGPPFTSAYTLQLNRWSYDDSVFSCGGLSPDGASVGDVDSGTFTMKGDTIQMRVSDVRIGVKGLVNLGRLRGDTLLIWGDSEEGDGDHLYLKARKQKP
jgi:hypothetical protein